MGEALGLEPEEKRQHRKMYQDMYEGDGQDNPSITARLLKLEDFMDKVQANMSKGFWVLVTTLVGVILNLVVQAWKH